MNKHPKEISGRECLLYECGEHPQRTIGPDHCTLVWEKGGHFVTPHLRPERAFAWCVNSLMK